MAVIAPRGFGEVTQLDESSSLEVPAPGAHDERWHDRIIGCPGPKFQQMGEKSLTQSPTLGRTLASHPSDCMTGRDVARAFRSVHLRGNPMRYCVATGGQVWHLSARSARSAAISVLRKRPKELGYLVMVRPEDDFISEPVYFGTKTLTDRLGIRCRENR